ncbi:hypothetical protein Chor_004783 [Crotalus horridus]
MSSSPLKERRSPVGLDCCSCCLDLANGPLGYNSNFTPLLQLREQLACESLGAAPELRRLMRQDSLEPVVRDPRYLLSRGMCNRNIDQTLLSILLFFHRICMKGLLAFSRDAPPKLHRSSRQKEGDYLAATETHQPKYAGADISTCI